MKALGEIPAGSSLLSSESLRKSRTESLFSGSLTSRIPTSSRSPRAWPSPKGSRRRGMTLQCLTRSRLSRRKGCLGTQFAIQRTLSSASRRRGHCPGHGLAGVPFPVASDVELRSPTGHHRRLASPAPVKHLARRNVLSCGWHRPSRPISARALSAIP